MIETYQTLKTHHSIKASHRKKLERTRREHRVHFAEEEWIQACHIIRFSCQHSVTNLQKFLIRTSNRNESLLKRYLEPLIEASYFWLLSIVEARIHGLEKTDENLMDRVLFQLNTWIVTGYICHQHDSTLHTSFFEEFRQRQRHLLEQYHQRPAFQHHRHSPDSGNLPEIHLRLAEQLTLNVSEKNWPDALNTLESIAQHLRFPSEQSADAGEESSSASQKGKGKRQAKARKKEPGRSAHTPHQISPNIPEQYLNRLTEEWKKQCTESHFYPLHTYATQGALALNECFSTLLDKTQHHHLFINIETQSHLFDQCTLWLEQLTGLGLTQESEQVVSHEFREAQERFGQYRQILANLVEENDRFLTDFIKSTITTATKKETRAKTGKKTVKTPSPRESSPESDSSEESIHVARPPSQMSPAPLEQDRPEYEEEHDETSQDWQQVMAGGRTGIPVETALTRLSEALCHKADRRLVEINGYETSSPSNKDNLIH